MAPLAKRYGNYFLNDSGSYDVRLKDKQNERVDYENPLFKEKDPTVVGDKEKLSLDQVSELYKPSPEIVAAPQPQPQPAPQPAPAPVVAPVAPAVERDFPREPPPQPPPKQAEPEPKPQPPKQAEPELKPQPQPKQAEPPPPLTPNPTPERQSVPTPEKETETTSKEVPPTVADIPSPRNEAIPPSESPPAQLRNDDRPTPAEDKKVERTETPAEPPASKEPTEIQVTNSPELTSAMDRVVDRLDRIILQLISIEGTIKDYSIQNMDDDDE